MTAEQLADKVIRLVGLIALTRPDLVRAHPPEVIRREATEVLLKRRPTDVPQAFRDAFAEPDR